MFSVLFLLLVLLYYSDGDMQISESEMIMQRVKRLTCNSDVNLSRMPGRLALHHKWYQAYPSECECLSECFTDCSAINLQSIDALNTHYTVELQKFDNNTNIYTIISVYNASNGLQKVFDIAVHCSGVQRKWISLVDDDYYRYQVDQIFTYGGTKSVKFNCQQYLHLSNLLEIQIGWITTTGDKIFTYKQTEIIMNLTDVHNGSMLCCLYYTTSAYTNGKHIQRFVKDKTLLIYKQETPNSKSQPTTTESYCENEGHRIITTSSTIRPFITDTSNATGGKNSNATKKTGIPSGTTNETSKYSGNTTETCKYSGTKNETSKYSGTKNETSKHSGNTTETSKYSGTTNETSKYSANTTETSKYSGNTTETSKYSGTTNETSKYSGNTTETSKYSGNTNETSKYSGNTTETSKYSGTKNETSKYSGTKNETAQKTNNTNTTVITTGTTNRTDSSNHDADATDYVIIIISSISAILVLLLIGICVIRRHYWKKRNRPKTAQLPLPQIPGGRLRPANEPDINTPFYLNLLFRRECELEIQAREEPHYEEVMYQQ